MRYPFAQFHGPIPNEGGAMSDHRLVVMHIMEGSLAGTDQWFHNPGAQASSHFGVGRDGSVIQWVDTDDTAWAEAAENSVGISIEHEGSVSGLPGLPPDLTIAQAVASARIIAWCNWVYGIPLARTSDPNGHGIIGHGELGQAGGGHLSCPGSAILNAVPGMLAWIGEQQHPTPPPTPPPAITFSDVRMPNLEPGQTHPAVQTLRDALIRHGYAAPPVGQRYGDSLAAVVTSYKQHTGKRANAHVNAAVWDSLLNS